MSTKHEKLPTSIKVAAIAGLGLAAVTFFTAINNPDVKRGVSYDNYKWVTSSGDIQSINIVASDEVLLPSKYHILPSMMGAYMEGDILKDYQNLCGVSQDQAGKKIITGDFFVDNSLRNNVLKYNNITSEYINNLTEVEAMSQNATPEMAVWYGYRLRTASANSQYTNIGGKYPGINISNMDTKEATNCTNITVKKAEDGSLKHHYQLVMSENLENSNYASNGVFVVEYILMKNNDDDFYNYSLVIPKNLTEEEQSEYLKYIKSLNLEATY